MTFPLFLWFSISSSSSHFSANLKLGLVRCFSSLQDFDLLLNFGVRGSKCYGNGGGGEGGGGSAVGVGRPLKRTVLVIRSP